MTQSTHFKPGAVLVGPGDKPGNTGEMPYESLIPDNPNFNGTTPPAGSSSEFQGKNQAREFGRQVAEVNPPLDRKIFR